MVKKNKKATVLENEPYILPSDNDEMRKFVTKFKIDMMEHVKKSIEFAIKNKREMVEVFAFKNTSFVVTISLKEFDENLEHIEKFYTEKEFFELIPSVTKTRQLLK